MAQYFRNYTQSPELLSPEVQRQRSTANALRQQSMQSPQGQMVSGHYVAPSFTQGLNQLFSGYAAGQLDKMAGETQQRQQNELSQALRTPKEIPQGIRDPNYQPPALTDRLAGLQDNPQAQQLAMQLRLREATREEQPRLQTMSGESYGFPKGTIVQVNPMTGQVTPLYQPEAPDYNQAVIMGPDGQPQVNPAYVQAQSQIRAAGRDGGVNIDMGNLLGGGQPQTEIGTVPPGYEAYYNPETKGYQYRPIPGGPAEREITELEQKQEGSREKEATTANLVSEDIGRAKQIIKQSPAMTTGLLGPILSKWGGSEAANLDSLLDTVGANISFDYLNTMRQNSPTGGALGNVTERELELLRATAGNLRQSQGADQLLFNLDRLERQFNEVINGPQGAQQQMTPEASQGGVDESLMQFMTPKERALFQ